MTDNERLDCLNTQYELNKGLYCKVCPEISKCRGALFKVLSDRMDKMKEKENFSNSES